MEQRSAGEVMASGQDPTRRGVGLGMRLRTLCTSIGPKAGAVLAGVGLYAVIGDVLSIPDAFVRPLYFNPSDMSALYVVRSAAGPLLAIVVGSFGSAMFAGWLLARRGWLCGLITALCLFLPDSVLSLWSLTLIPLDSYGDLGDFLAGWPWAVLPPSLPACGIFGIFLLPSFGVLLVAAFGGFCGERLRLRRARESDA